MLFDKMKGFFGKKKKDAAQPDPLAEMERIKAEAEREFAELERMRAVADRIFAEEEPVLFEAAKRAQENPGPFEEEEPPFAADEWAKAGPEPFEEDKFRPLGNARDDPFAEMERIKDEMDSAEAEAEAARIRAEAEAARIRAEAEAARTQAAGRNASAAPQPWRKEFTFQGRTPEWVNGLNAELSGRKFTELKLENFSGYLSTERRTDADGREISVSYRYGLDNCVMTGTQAEDGFVYRMDTEVTDSSVDSRIFADSWRMKHPGRVIRVLTCVGFNEKHAFIILHHEKAAEPQPAAPQPWRKEYTFPGRGPEWLDELNAALSMKRFADLRLESFHGYFVSESRTDAEGRSISAARYGLDDCVLAGREAADGFICRVAAEVFSSVVPSKHFEMMWRGRHPGCSVVSLTCVNQGAQNAYIILYHSR